MKIDIDVALKRFRDVLADAFEIQEKYEELQEAIIKYLDNRPDDEQGTIEERSKFEPIKEKLEILLGVEAGRWG